MNKCANDENINRIIDNRPINGNNSMFVCLKYAHAIDDRVLNVVDGLLPQIVLFFFSSVYVIFRLFAFECGILLGTPGFSIEPHTHTHTTRACRTAQPKMNLVLFQGECCNKTMFAQTGFSICIFQYMQ